MAASDTTPLRLTLAPLPGAVLKSQQPELLRRLENSKFVVEIRRAYEVHGLQRGEGSKYASLIVLQIKLSNENQDRVSRFRFFQLKLRFQRDPAAPLAGTLAADAAYYDPEISEFGPAQGGAMNLSESSVKMTDTASLEGGAAGGVLGASLTGKGTLSRATEHNRPYYHRVEATSHKSTSKGREGEDVVQWTLTEDCNTKTGVGDLISVYVLVKRRDEAKFLIHVDTEAKINYKYWMTEKWRRAKRHMAPKKGIDYDEAEFEGSQSGQISPLRIDVSRPNGRVPAGVDVNRLLEAGDKDVLTSLGYLHVPEPVAPRQVYQAGPGAAVPAPRSVEPDGAAKLVAASANVGAPVPVAARQQTEPGDQTVSADEDSDYIVSDDDDEPRAQGAAEAHGFTKDQLDYVHSLLAAASLYHTAQDRLFILCNRLRRTPGIPQDIVTNAKAVLRGVEGQRKLADSHLKPFELTRQLIKEKELEIPPSTALVSDVDKALLPIPFREVGEINANGD